MKSKLILFLSCISIINIAQASRLNCQILNLATNRIVDQKISDYPENNRPILLILSVGELMGTVRDTVGPTATDRSLNLQFSYGFPGGPNPNGIGTSYAKYNIDQDMTNLPLAEVEMTDPSFPIEYSLQCYLIN